MNAQIRVEYKSIKIQFGNKLIGNKTYGYALSTKVPESVYDTINEFIGGGATLKSLSSSSDAMYAPCDFELRDTEKWGVHYQATIYANDKKLKIVLKNLSYDFESWYKYANDKSEKCPNCGKSYPAVIKGGKLCDCQKNEICCCCGINNVEYHHGGDAYCESCFYDTFSICDECDRTSYTYNCIYYHDAVYCEKCAYRKLFNCHACGEITAYDDFCFEYDGNEYCESCFLDDFSTCENCHNDVPNDEINKIGKYNKSWHTEFWCDSCWGDAQECKECGEKFCGDDGEFCSASCETIYEEEYKEDEEKEGVVL